MKDDFLSSCTSGGCGSKIGAGELNNILKNINVYEDKNILVGFDSLDDAAVYKINDETSFISTTDFFSPMIKDPKIFGQIAAANALSDVYAMGGKPVTALNIVCFPKNMDIKILGQILEGGGEKIAEAETVLAGGHSIYDKETKYGLAVTGLVNNNKIIRNNTPRIGDKIILTKPLGVGIIMAANRVNMASDLALEKAINSMTHLNKYSAEKMLKYNISACTDVTGFGMLIHMTEMINELVSFEININQVPFIEEAYNYAEEYILTSAGQKNRNHIKFNVDLEKLSFPLQELFLDPQTSGGLLICVENNQGENLLKEIQEKDKNAKIIGQVIEKKESPIIFL